MECFQSSSCQQQQQQQGEEWRGVATTIETPAPVVTTVSKSAEMQQLRAEVAELKALRAAHFFKNQESVTLMLQSIMQQKLTMDTLMASTSSPSSRMMKAQTIQKSSESTSNWPPVTPEEIARLPSWLTSLPCNQHLTSCPGPETTRSKNT
jgi:hypothetical protein